jgi:hypothetical protein
MASHTTDPASRFEERTRGILDKCQRDTGVIRLAIWAITLIGFIGTVVGIIDAMGSFSSMFGDSNVGASTLVGKFQSVVGQVMTGLSVAFNTTLVALVVVLPVAFIAEGSFSLEENLFVSGRVTCLKRFWLWIGPAWRTDLNALSERDEQVGVESLSASVHHLASQIGAMSNCIAGIHGIIGELGTQVSRLEYVLEQLDIEGESQKGSRGETPDRAP